MLLRYKKAFEKISMGLLSFMPHEKDVKKLLETIHKYETNPDWHLFLWKKNEDLVGLVGVRMNNTDGIIQHLSVNPSHRGEGIGKEMLQSLSSILHTSSIQPTEEIKSFYEKCQIEKEED
ncbi:GNAT family N-acetyltransferase [Psychrobacillus sp. OK032]|uniref:GNAT family N-acetyltransferase n=1 Tax=Psychrobacillus sp. OK032 TaxID=1884358 RepID=UPI0008CFA9A6|nr:GNAT family N-acetyltransferase [Psychrobacillus sp. OK032]SES34163.1 riboflavin biosynthesis RibT protein [Psychrobacillus sp. OK032]